jgi:hypothetical protein
MLSLGRPRRPFAIAVINSSDGLQPLLQGRDPIVNLFVWL